MATTELALLSLTLGMPVTLVAVALLANAYVAWRGAPGRSALAAGASAAGDAAEEELVSELSAAIEDLRRQLTRQREALGGMLSDGAAEPEHVPAASPFAGVAAAPGAGRARVAE